MGRSCHHCRDPSPAVARAGDPSWPGIADHLRGGCPPAISNQDPTANPPHPGSFVTGDPGFQRISSQTADHPAHIPDHGRPAAPNDISKARVSASSTARGKHLGALVRPSSPSCSRVPVLPLARARSQEQVPASWSAALPRRTDCCRPIRQRAGVKGRFACTLTTHLTCVRGPAVRSALEAGPEAYHHPAAVWRGGSCT